MKSTMSMSRKLTAATAALFVIAGALGAWGFFSLRSFRSQFDVVSDEGTRRVLLADAIVTANSELISAQRGIILASFAKDSAELDKYQQLFKQNAQVVSSTLDEMRPLLRDPESKSLASGIAARLAEWQPHFAEVVRNAAADNVPEANRIRKEVTAPLYKEIEKQSRQLTADQSRLVAAGKLVLAAEYSRSVWMSVSLLALFVLVGGVVILVVQRITGDLRKSIAELADGAAQVGNAASQVAASSQSLARGSSEQAASLEETSASTEEINSMASRNRENSQSAVQLVTESQTRFAESDRSLNGMVSAMNEIGNSSGKISKIIKVIDEIAFQTNILALNAAVEAARAGEAGMGFAVVAEEVRSLAQRCAQAAKDTAALIEESISRSADGKAQVDHVAAAIKSISDQSAKVKVLVDEVNLGSQEQARGLDQISKAIVQMEQMTQRTAASAEESAAASEELNTQSAAMKSVVARLTEMVEGASR